MKRFVLMGLSLLSIAPAVYGQAKPPVAVDDRLTIELIAQEPAIVTPTGIFADVRDNVWAIESNTHFPPKNYKGHPTDRLWIFSGYEQADVPTKPASPQRPGTAVPGTIDPQTGLAPGVKRTLFVDGLMQAASVMLTPDGKIYVTCRNEIVYFEDKDHDFKPDTLDLGDGKKADRKTLVRLETKATYPHNGLNGAVLSPDGDFFYYCLGLNTGFDYSMIGSDGSKMTGGGEGGSVWRCTPTGGKVERIAIGFWNCHDLTFDAFGRLFAVDNDPDDIGPCRLLDIIEGGDYGWKFKNGRKGVHPFTSWNGQLPGTLPMVAPTGEAPSGILAYESDNLPADYRGQLLVTSWGDHVIHRYTLKEKGASFESTPIEMIRGGEDFRPVAITQASDGSVFVTDWVDKSYTLHSKGKLWRIRAKARDSEPREPSGSAAGAVAKRLRVDDVAAMPLDESLLSLIHNPRREIRVAASSTAVLKGGDQKLWVRVNKGNDERAAVQAFWSLPTDKRDAAITEAQDGGTTAVKAEGYRRAWRLGLKRADEGAFYAMDNRYHAGDFGLYVYRTVVLGLPIDSTLEFRLVAIPADPFISSAKTDALVRSKKFRSFMENPQESEESLEFGYAMAARESDHAKRLTLLPEMLRHRDFRVRRLALQWIGEERLTQFADNLPDALKAGYANRDLLATYLAAQEKLKAPLPEPGKPPAEQSGQQYAIAFLFDETNDLNLRRTALELIDPADPKLSADRLVALIKPMGEDAIKAVAWREDETSQAALREVAADAKRDVGVRQIAVVGLARSALASAPTKDVLRSILFARALPTELRLESLRSLRGALDAADADKLVKELTTAATKDQTRGPVFNEPEWASQIVLAFKPNPDALSAELRKRLEILLPKRPTDTAGWQAITKEGGDPVAGQKVFALATGARCYICHQHDNRGGVVGPDLSGVGRAMDRAKLVESILEPSKEVAPLYVSSVIELKNGDTISGVNLPEPGASFVSIADASGKRKRIKADDIVSRRPEKLSVMPEGLVDSMSVKEFQDLIAYLAK